MTKIYVQAGKNININEAERQEKGFFEPWAYLWFFEETMFSGDWRTESAIVEVISHPDE